MKGSQWLSRPGIAGKQFTRPVARAIVTGVLLALFLALAAVPAALGLPSMTVTKVDTLVVDGDGDGVADPGDTIRYTMTITNSGSTNASGAAVADTIDANTTLEAASVRTTPIARNDTYTSLGNVGITVPAGNGVLANDNDPDGTTPTLTVIAAAGATAQGGAYSIGSDGSFSYQPPAGFEGADSFSYTVQDSNANQDPATVFITVSDVIWFIDNSAGAVGNGTLTNPYNSLVSFNSSAADDTGDIIFIYTGSGGYEGGTALLSNQILIGQGATAAIATVAGISVPSHSNPLPATGGASPTITNSSGDGVSLAQNNLLRGFDVGNTAGVGIADGGGTVGTLTISEVGISGSGGGIEVDNGGTLAVTLNSLSAGGGVDEGIDLENVGGSFAVTGGGTVNMTGIPAVVVDGNPSLSLNVTLTSISTSGGPRGLSLQDTGGSFTVSGSGGTASGGTLSGHSGEGVLLNNTGAVSLTDMVINQGSTSNTQGIDATNVNGLALVRATITAGSGDSYALLGSSVRDWTSTASIYDGGGGSVPNIDGVFITNLLGSSILDGSTFRNGKDINLLVENTTNGGGQDSLTIAGSSFSNSAGGDHLQVEADGTANLKLVVQAGTGGNNTFSGTGQDGMQLEAEGNATLEAVVTGATINNNQGSAVNLATVVNGHIIARIHNLTGLSSGATNVLNAISFDNSQIEVTFENNIIDMGGTAFNGIRLVQEGNGTVTARVAGNNITGLAQERGIYAIGRVGSVGSSGTMNATISGNTVNVSGGLSLDGMELAAGSSTGTDGNTLCLNLFSNNSTSANFDGYYLNRSASATFQLQDFGGPATSAGITNWVQSVKGNTGSVFVEGASGFTAAPAACPTPTVPTAAPAITTATKAQAHDPGPGFSNPRLLTRDSSSDGYPRLSGTIDSAPATGPAARAPLSGETVNVTLGTLNPGQVVTVQFDVTVDGMLPDEVVQVCNQALLSGSNFANVASDDPDVGGTEDPTCTGADPTAIRLRAAGTAGSVLPAWLPLLLLGLLLATGLVARRRGSGPPGA